MIITINKGPQFLNGKAFILLFVVVVLIIFLIVNISEKQYISTSILFVLVIISGDFMLDFEAIEIDKENSKIRVCKKHLWHKIGTWTDFNDYQAIYLDFNIENIEETSFVAGDEVGLNKNVKYLYFHTVLVSNDSKNNIILKSHHNYKKANEFSISTAKQLELPYKNMVKLRYQKSKSNPRK